MQTTVTDPLLATARASFVDSMPMHFTRLGLSADDLAQLRTERIRKLLACAQEQSPFHARRLAGVDAASFVPEDLVSLPVMTKQNMMDAFDDVVTDRRLTRQAVDAHVAAAGERPTWLYDEFLVMATGGSSGLRGVFVYSMPEAVEFVSAVLRAGLAQLAAQTGWPPTRPVPFAVVAAPIGIHATRAMSPIVDGTVADLTLAPVTLPFDEIVQRVQRAQPVILVGYTSTVARLADAQVDGRLSIRPSTVIVTSEQLTDPLRERIAAGFGTPPVNSYGSTEGLIGTAPPGNDVFTFAGDLAIVEFVDADHNPVGPGAEAEHVLITNLFNLSQPLIRYRIEDRMVQVGATAGHGHPRASLEGRADEHLIVDGVSVHGLVLRSVMVQHPDVVDFQVRSRGRSIDVMVVSAPSLDVETLTSQIHDAVVRAGATVNTVTVTAVESIPRDHQSGKASRFING